MDIPVLDPRTKVDILREIADGASRGRFESGGGDGAFADVLFRRAGALNALPEALYGELVRMLGEDALEARPRMCFVRFDPSPGHGEPVRIPKGSRFRCDEDGRPEYETAEDICAVPSELKGVFYTEAGQSMVWKLDSSFGMPLFQSQEKGRELSGHSFRIADSRMLSVSGPCVIEIEFRQGDRQIQRHTAELLAEESFAKWSYFNGKNILPFASVRAEDGIVILEKDTDDRLCPDSSGDIGVSCKLGGPVDISIKNAYIRCLPSAPAPADAMAAGDVPVPGEGGYCFGRQPEAGDVFYIRSDSLFSKCGAEAELGFDLESRESTVYNGQPLYELGKPIIDKKDAVVIQPDEVFIQQLVWEYYNGEGWRAMDVSGTANPFDGKAGGDARLRFTVPEDISPVTVNFGRGYHIRARVVYVENHTTRFPKWIAPFVKGISCRWSYGERVPVNSLSAENNGQISVLRGYDRGGKPDFELCRVSGDEPRAVYMCFDSLPEACPLSLFLNMSIRSAKPVGLTVEGWTGERFEKLDIRDDTGGLTRNGCVMVNIRKNMPKAEFFGAGGAWLRLTTDVQPEPCPVAESIELNAVPALGRQMGTGNGSGDACCMSCSAENVSAIKLAPNGDSRSGTEEPARGIIRRGRRAVSARDFEELVRGNVSDLKAVKCFSGTDETGKSASGHVCLVLLGRDMSGRAADELCREACELICTRCDSALVSSGRLHVVPARLVDMNIDLLLRARGGYMTETAREEIVRAISEYIDSEHGIGEQVDLCELERRVRELESVDAVKGLNAEYSWPENGKQRYMPADAGLSSKFGAVKVGEINIALV
ncbi:MAG: hypothetical protein IJG63_02950 [Oscillospiraceae bacterium]|nr:hypothetical protein [Oscillospiraceae bacterium]